MGDWITTLPNPLSPHVVPHFRLFAVLGTWMEADVIAATIRNATTQGCERIYVIDNGSTDDTTTIAVHEGAIIARSFITERYDEALRLRHMNEVVATVSSAENAEHIWWLFLDADEFPHGPFGMTIRAYLETLDRQFTMLLCVSLFWYLKP